MTELVDILKSNYPMRSHIIQPEPPAVAENINPID